MDFGHWSFDCTAVDWKGTGMMKRCADRMSRLVLNTLIIFICVVSTQAKRTDDVVTMKNGDQLTGEIKSLQRCELKFKSSYMAEAVRLDWSKVERLESKDQYLVLLTDGKLITDFVQLRSARHDEADNFLIGGSPRAIKVRQV